MKNYGAYIYIRTLTVNTAFLIKKKIIKILFKAYGEQNYKKNNK